MFYSWYLFRYLFWIQSIKKTKLKEKSLYWPLQFITHYGRMKGSATNSVSPMSTSHLMSKSGVGKVQPQITSDLQPVFISKTNICKQNTLFFFIGTQPCPFIWVWLLSYYKDRPECLRQRQYDPQNEKHWFSGPLQKMFSDPWSKWLPYISQMVEN